MHDLAKLPEWRPVEVSTTVPPVDSLSDTPAADLVRKLHGLVMRAYEAAAAHGRLITESAYVAAHSADIAAMGAALANGEDDPGDVNVERLKADVAAAHRLASGLAQAAQIAKAELGDALLDEPGEQWADDLDERRTAGLKRLTDALDELRAADAELATVRNECAWFNQALSNLRGELNRNSSALVAWPASYGVARPRVTHSGRDETVEIVADTIRDYFENDRGLLPAHSS